MPATNSLVLDTTVVVAFFRGDASAAQLLANTEFLYLPLIALGELFVGIERAQNRAKGGQQLQQLLTVVAILYPDTETAAIYGRLKASLFSQGRPIPDNDIWIAASALQSGLHLAARDVHFVNIPNLQLTEV